MKGAVRVWYNSIIIGMSWTNVASSPVPNAFVCIMQSVSGQHSLYSSLLQVRAFRHQVCPLCCAGILNILPQSSLPVRLSWKKMNFYREKEREEVATQSSLQNAHARRIFKWARWLHSQSSRSILFGYNPPLSKAVIIDILPEPSKSQVLWWWCAFRKHLCSNFSWR